MGYVAKSVSNITEKMLWIGAAGSHKCGWDDNIKLHN